MKMCILCVLSSYACFIRINPGRKKKTISEHKSRVLEIPNKQNKTNCDAPLNCQLHLKSWYLHQHSDLKSNQTKLTNWSLKRITENVQYNSIQFMNHIFFWNFKMIFAVFSLCFAQTFSYNLGEFLANSTVLFIIFSLIK